MEIKLLKASCTGDTITIRKLIRKKVDVNIRDGHGVCALSIASKGGHTDAVKLLLEAQADPNLHDGVYTYPLHLAARENHTDIVKLLVLGGASVESLNKDGFKPADLADFNTESWEILQDAVKGHMPQLEEVIDTPFIPDHAINPGARKVKSAGKKGKKGKGKKGKGKKGKKGKKKKK